MPTMGIVLQVFSLTMLCSLNLNFLSLASNQIVKLQSATMTNLNRIIMLMRLDYADDDGDDGDGKNDLLKREVFHLERIKSIFLLYNSSISLKKANLKLKHH